MLCVNALRSCPAAGVQCGSIGKSSQENVSHTSYPAAVVCGGISRARYRTWCLRSRRHDHFSSPSAPAVGAHAHRDRVSRGHIRPPTTTTKRRALGGGGHSKGVPAIYRVPRPVSCARKTNDPLFRFFFLLFPSRPSPATGLHHTPLLAPPGPSAIPSCCSDRAHDPDRLYSSLSLRLRCSSLAPSVYLQVRLEAVDHLLTALSIRKAPYGNGFVRVGGGRKLSTKAMTYRCYRTQQRRRANKIFVTLLLKRARARSDRGSI